jgi:hypothetical protein
MKAYGGVDVQIQSFLTSELAEGECSGSRTGRFTPGEWAPVAHWIGGCVDPRTGLGDVEKRKFFPYTRTRNSDHSVLQPVVRRYTDYVIPAPED